jgi:hypothetical protein
MKAATRKKGAKGGGLKENLNRTRDFSDYKYYLKTSFSISLQTCP